MALTLTADNVADIADQPVLDRCTFWNGDGIRGYVQHQAHGVPFQLSQPSVGKSWAYQMTVLTAADARKFAAELIAHADAWDAEFGTCAAVKPPSIPLGELLAEGMVGEVA